MLQAEGKREGNQSVTSGKTKGNVGTQLIPVEYAPRMIRSVRIEVLGPLAVVDPTVDREDQVPLPTSANARRLLGILALEPGLHSRRSMLELLWPEDELDDYDRERAARDRLKGVIQQARKALGRAGQSLVTDATVDTIGLDLKSGLIETDCAVERDLRIQNKFREALQLHRGKVLQGWNDSWIVTHREHQASDLRRVLGNEYGLDGPTLERAVEDLLRQGGQTWVADSESRIQGIRDSEADVIGRVAAAFRDVSGNNPAIGWQVIDRNNGLLELCFNNAQGDGVFLPLDREAVNLLSDEAPPEAVALAALTGQSEQATGRLSSSGPDVSECTPTMLLRPIEEHLEVRRDVIVEGESAAGKTVTALQVSKDLRDFGWETTYFDLGASESKLGGLVLQLVRAENRPAARHLLVFDNIQGNPGLSVTALDLVRELRGAGADFQLLAVTWPSGSTLVRDAMPESEVVPCNGSKLLGEIAESLHPGSLDVEVLESVERLASGDLLISRFVLAFHESNLRLPSLQELAEVAFNFHTRSLPLDQASLRLLHEVAALGQFEIQPKRSYLAARYESSLDLLISEGILRMSGPFVTVGHRSLAVLITAYLESKVPDLKKAIEIAVDYLSRAADRQVLATLQRLDMLELNKDSSQDQHGSVYLARAWSSARMLSHFVSRQTEIDETWGSNLASAIFAAETLARFDVPGWRRIAAFVRSSWSVNSHSELQLEGSEPSAEFDDFREIIKRMAEQDEAMVELPSGWEASSQIDGELMHRSWLLGLLLGFEALAPEPDFRRRAALIHAADRALSPVGYFYPSRVPWVTARVLLGLSSLGESVSNSETVRLACERLMEPAPNGPNRFGVWESGTGSWNTEVMTTAMCVIALLRCGVSVTNPTVKMGAAYVLEKTDEWSAPGQEIDAATTLEMRLLMREHWTSTTLELTRLLDWTREEDAWEHATDLASLSQDESSKVPALASSLVRIVWVILRNELPILLEGVAMDIARRVTDQVASGEAR